MQHLVPSSKRLPSEFFEFRPITALLCVHLHAAGRLLRASLTLPSPDPLHGPSATLGAVSKEFLIALATFLPNGHLNLLRLRQASKSRANVSGLSKVGTTVVPELKQHCSQTPMVSCTSTGERASRQLQRCRSVESSLLKGWRKASGAATPVKVTTTSPDLLRLVSSYSSRLIMSLLISYRSSLVLDPIFFLDFLFISSIAFL